MTIVHIRSVYYVCMGLSSNHTHVTLIQLWRGPTPHQIPNGVTT